MTAARFLSLLFTALALAPALAHLLELPNKIGLPRGAYLTVQRIYDGWALLGFVVYAAFFSTLALAILTRHSRREFRYAFAAFLCIAGTQAVFWTFTFPMNRATQNWTVLPDSWMAMRAQWEYSHAAAAVLNLAALVATILCVLASPNIRQNRK